MEPGADTGPTADSASLTLCRENTLTATLTATAVRVRPTR